MTNTYHHCACYFSEEHFIFDSQCCISLLGNRSPVPAFTKVNQGHKQIFTNREKLRNKIELLP